MATASAVRENRGVQLRVVGESPDLLGESAVPASAGMTPGQVFETTVPPHDGPMRLRVEFGGGRIRVLVKPE